MRRPGSHRRRSSPLTLKQRSANKSKQQQQQQQALLLSSPTATDSLTNSQSEEESNCTMAALECMLGLARVFGMESCLLSADERTSANGSTSPTSPGRRGKRSTKRRPGSRGSSVEGLRGTPGRLAGCGSSLSGAACMFTQQGKKGVNQDAMLVWEVSLFSFLSFVLLYL